MKTIYSMILATLLFAACNVACGHPVIDPIELSPDEEQALLDACLSDYILDWHDKRCDRFRPTGDGE